MEVNLEKRYPLEVDGARAWQVLRDIPRVASCMPGAAITEQVDETHFKGTVKVKVGPATASFAGDIEVLAFDEASRSIRLLGKGADRGGSSASMQLTAHLETGETPASSVLVGKADVIVNGKFAQFGGRMMVQVSEMLLAQFVDNFRAEAASVTVPVAEAANSAQHAMPAGAPTVTEGAGVALASAPAPSSSALAVPPASTALPSAPRAAKEINGLAILWGLIKAWVAGLFGRRT